MTDTTGLTQGKNPYEFRVGEFVVLSSGTTNYGFGDRDGIVVEIRRGGVVVNLDRHHGMRTRNFEPTDLYHINKGWYGGTYEPRAE
jgi:hypothetical protein